MAEADITEFILKLIIIAVFAVVVIGGIFLITEFKATVKTSSLTRLGIDFGENVLSSSCTADGKGLLNETKLNRENADYGAGKNGLSGFSCIKSAFIARTLITAKSGAEEKKWGFGFDEKRKYEIVYEFPASVNYSDGSVIPAILKVYVGASADCNIGNGGNDCYNCLKREECESTGCSWHTDPEIEDGLCLPR